MHGYPLTLKETDAIIVISIKQYIFYIGVLSFFSKNTRGNRLLKGGNMITITDGKEKFVIRNNELWERFEYLKGKATKLKYKMLS